jgi:RNA polymerase sigma-70 factor (ECF subfamily)
MTAIQFQQKVVNLHENMFNFAMILTSNHKHNAEDLTQETVLKVLNSQHKYVDNTNFKGWVLTIMRNLYLNDYRKFLRNGLVMTTAAGDDFFELYLVEDSKTLHAPENALFEKQMYSFIKNLDVELKAPLLLFLSGYHYNEISERLQMPLGTVKSRIFFARRELQKSIGNEFYLEEEEVA